VTVRNDLCDLPDAAVAFLLQYGPAMAGAERDEQAGYVPSFCLAKSRGTVYDTFMKTPTLPPNYIQRSLGRPALLLVSLLIGFFALCQEVQSATDTPDPGAKPLSNTADGQGALLSITTGLYNSAFGFDSLLSITDGNFCTGVGAGTLLVNTGDQNTAVGAGALLSNADGENNSAVGAFALFNNVSGNANNAHGLGALESNVDGSGNNAFGKSALLENVSGGGNTAIGDDALFNCNGNENVGVGHGAGFLITTGNNIIAIGAGVNGVSTQFGEVDDSCYIGNIYGAVISDNAAFVFVDADGKVGTGAVDANGNKVALPSPQAMLNEFLKGQKRVAELESIVAQQAQAMEVLTAQLKEQAAQIQKVSAHVELSKPEPQIVNNNQ